MKASLILIGAAALGAWFLLKPKDDQMQLPGGGGGGISTSPPTNTSQESNPLFGLPSVTFPSLPESAFTGGQQTSASPSPSSQSKKQTNGTIFQVTSPSGATGYHAISPTGVGLSTSSLPLAQSVASGGAPSSPSTSKKSTNASLMPVPKKEPIASYMR